MPDFPEFVDTLKKLHLKRKGNRPKVSPQKFYPSQVELQTQELIREELGEYAYRLQTAAMQRGVQGVYDVPGAVPQGFDEKVQKVAEAVSLFQVKAFSNFSEMSVGERYFPAGGESRDVILNTWSDNFVNLCKSTNEEMRKKVAGVISDGVLGGRNIRELTKDIQNTCKDFSRTKAELIAVTEVGKLNTAITRNQSESSGIEFYEWAAPMDGRTRESHAVMDGKICKWGDDDHYYEWETDAKTGKRKLVRKPRPANAYRGAPGTDYRCRCVALPYVPEYEDDYVREKGPVQGVAQGENADPATVRSLKERSEGENRQNVKMTRVSYLSEKRLKSELPESIKRSKELENKIFGKRTPRPRYITLDIDGAIQIDEQKYEKYQRALKSKRKNKEGDEVDKFNREKEIAEMMRRLGFSTILIGERKAKGVPNPDAIVDGRIAEFKQVGGVIGRVEDNLKKALKQGGKIIALNIKSDLNIDDVSDIVKKRIYGRKDVVVYVNLNDKMYMFQ